jgi:acetolactate synthase-1/2/3 large subunit
MTRNEWIEKCNHWKNIWPTITPDYLQDTGTGLNLYAVLNALNTHSNSEHIYMSDAGSSFYVTPVALNIKEGQKCAFSPSQGDMGWALPGSIGVALASNRPVISIMGDGSFMTNMQELAVAKQHELNIAFVILNNGGYLSIKNTQQKYFDGRVYGTSSETGLWFPNFADVASSFGIGYHAMRTVDQLETFESILNETGPRIIDCFCTPNQEILPSQALKNGKQAGLHDLFPFLSDEELSQEMIAKLP